MWSVYWYKLFQFNRFAKINQMAILEHCTHNTTWQMTCLQAICVEQSIKYYISLFHLQAPVLTMCGSFAEARVPGTPPDPSCPLIWVRQAVPPYASLTVSCSACSSSRDSSESGFNPHKQPASSPLALRHSSVVCWFGGGCRGLWDGLYWQQQRFGYKVGKLEFIFIFYS